LPMTTSASRNFTRRRYSTRSSEKALNKVLRRLLQAVAWSRGARSTVRWSRSTCGRSSATGSASSERVPPRLRPKLDQLIELVGKGALHGPVIDRELPLEQAAEAHRLIENRETFGKVVLKP
jgi:NADPH:quinone reductase-like Zn-dependent oxidoreductase